MPFTAAEIENIANALLDFHMDTGKVYSQTIQSKPLLRDMRAAMKTFAGGKENITTRVKGDYTTTIMGYTHDDTVSYQNPANIKTSSTPWKEIHWGIEMTLTELKKEGVSVVDSANGKSTVQHTDREKFVLANLLDDKIEDMMEGSARGMNDMFWKDGAQDAKQVPGVRSIILDDPTSATIVAGIDQSINTWWRNRASLSIDSSTPSNQNLVNKLQTEFRQLMRYGTPKHKLYAGSDLIEALEKELRSNGTYTQDGFMNNGKTDAGMADLSFKRKPIVYDPTLDDLGYAKYLYVIDTKGVYPKVMEGEDNKKHYPARPHDQYVMYRAMTWTGGLCVKQRNTSGVYSIA